VPKRSGAYYNLDPTPDNFRLLWEAIHGLLTTQKAHTATLADHDSQLSDHTSAIQSASDTANQAVVIAGQTVNASPTTPSGTSGSGTGSGSNPPTHTGDEHPNHQALIQQAKDELVALSEDLTGPCGAFKIIQRAVPYIQASDPSAGFLSKPTGTNCSGFATDIVCYSDGLIYDVLGAAGDGDGITTGNTVQWNFAGTTDPGRYRATA
jgi:hypothetical protein